MLENLRKAAIVNQWFNVTQQRHNIKKGLTMLCFVLSSKFLIDSFHNVHQELIVSSSSINWTSFLYSMIRVDYNTNAVRRNLRYMLIEVTYINKSFPNNWICIICSSQITPWKSNLLQQPSLSSFHS